MRLNHSTLAALCLVVVVPLIASACSLSQGAPGTPIESTKGLAVTQAPGPLPTGTATPTQTALAVETGTPEETAMPSEAAPPEAMPPEATLQQATQTAVVDSSTPGLPSLCPQPGKDTSLYISQEKGFCFLVPAGFTIQGEQLRPGEVVTLLGPTETLGPKQQEGIRVLLSIEANGPADGMDSAAYAREWHKRFATPEDPYHASDATIGGQAATVLSDLPGYAQQQAAFIIANGARYRINLTPQPQDMPELADAAQSGWDTVINSMVFFSPDTPVQAVKPDDVCSLEGESTHRYVNELEGYCFLYPSGFEPQADFPGAVTGGPVVGQWEGGDVIPSVTVGYYTPPSGMTPREILEGRIQFVQPGSIEDATIGGYPAVTFIDINGAWPSRQAIVVVDPSRAYSVLAQPLDEARFPDAPPYVDQGWETVTSSLAFFDPWR